MFKILANIVSIIVSGGVLIFETAIFPLDVEYEIVPKISYKNHI